MVGDSKLRRMDLVALRLRIQNALGQEKWPKYWSLLQRFMRFKLSKEELDNDARAVLGNDNVALHNQLIRGIFQNAIINTVHPPAVETPVAPDPFDPPVRADKKKKKKAQPPGPNVGPTGREPGKAALSKREQQDRLSHDIIWLREQEMLRTQWTICDGADLYDESLELPSLVKLRHTMRKRCRDYSLDVPQESVEFLQKSVEVYLGEVMKQLQKAAKLRRFAAPAGSRSPTSSTSSSDAAEWATITYEDFENAQQFAPEGLQLSTVVNMERRLLLQHQEW